MRRRTTAAVAATTLLSAGAAAALAVAVTNRRSRGTPAAFPTARLTVHATAAGRVTLTRTAESVLPGTYALVGDDCRAIVGPVVDHAPDSTPDTVVRRLERVVHGDLTPGSAVTLSPQLHAGDPGSALGIDFTEVEVTGDRGAMPSWFVPGLRDTWVVVLHGLGATRELSLNLLPFLHHQELSVLVPGDPDEHADRPEPTGLGSAEWTDAEAALRHAVRCGARSVVLYGTSTGATMALHTAVRSPLRGRITGLVLDSPVLDPAATVRALARHRGVPGALWPLAVRTAEDVEAPPPDLDEKGRGTTLPVLVVHGPDDTIAPWEASRALVERHPGTTTLHPVPDAGHAAMWNADPAAYEEVLRRFLTPLM
ncbi:alpha/beta hydrolase [Streptomyces avicenniae]|uniref:alpha/beta hydrolase n=1 Tax=Streptomyces avicenniae TaxID=500153 RepID=UPI000699A673|nr:alpha/beta hydrolase [Streptomyces avicenniae]